MNDMACGWHALERTDGHGEHGTHALPIGHRVSPEPIKLSFLTVDLREC